jgi:hypothetical protein
MVINNCFQDKQEREKKFIQGRCKKYTLNENLSMAMYALIHKLQQFFLKRNPNYEIKKFQIQIQKKTYYKIKENYKPRLSIYKLFQNLKRVTKLS